MVKRWLMWTLLWAAVTAGAFAVMNWILALCIGVFGLTVLVVVIMASDWDSHSSFDDRELARARKRKAKYERRAGARAKERARWEAHQARKAARG